MTSHDVEIKAFSLTKHKPRARMDYEGIGKTISKYRDKKIKKKTENQSQNATCEQKSTSKKKIWFKEKNLGLE